MNIFLTGATGYLGSAILRALESAGHRVTALVRSPSAAVRHPHIGDLRSVESFRDVALSHDAIIHAGIESGSERLDTDRRVAEALASPKLIYTSTLFVLGNVDDGDESSPATGPRAETERVVVDAGGAVIRPGMIHGGDAFLFAHPIVIGDGSNRWPLVHRDDVAALYVLVVERGARGVFHAVSEVRRAREVFPDVAPTAIDVARGELGPFADALALDQNVRAERSRALGWIPSRL
ncbi:MAG TPA: NAD-dependent epimerase/dehydratase family protein [Thermoanaerobaculia bacterium]|jgi:nucleoside-diphosphate-sugar epimerase